MTDSAFIRAARAVVDGADHHQQAEQLVAEMTVAERLGCLDGDTPFWPGLIDMGSGGYYEHPWPAAAVDRLGVPGIHFADGPRGCVVGRATAFPVPMARGASFDPDLEHRIGEAIGAELRASGATYTGAVCINLLRHPAWGRAQETYGEDPYHVGVMAEQAALGLQRHVIACMKHFALNSMENARFTVDVTVDERSLHEVYLPHFRRVAAAGIGSVMSAYNSVNGEWCGENRNLLTTILRDEWGWDGFVTSDFVFGVRDPVGSVAAGLNIEMPFRQQRAVALRAALDDGRVRLADVDARVNEIVATLLRFWPVIGTAPPAASIIAGDDHRALAREACSSSLVLVRNEGDLLPIDPDRVRRIAVIGRLADVANLGDGGSSDVHPPTTVTPLQGLRAAMPGVDVRDALDDASLAEGCDIAIVVVGLTKADEGEFLDNAATGALASLFPPMDDPELGFAAQRAAPTRPEADRPAADRPAAMASGGDRTSLRLHPDDEALIGAVSAVNARTVVVVMSGSAVVMPWLDSVGAVLMLWYPGMEGGHALADVITGRSEPGGRLPFAVPVDEADLVAFDRDSSAVTYDLFHGQWLLDRNGTPPALPFGFGLSYTRFILGSPAAVAVVDDPARFVVEVAVDNVGRREGACVVQVYATVVDSAYERPPSRLVGFVKLRVGAGATVEAQIPISLRTVAVRVGGTFLVEPGVYRLSVGQFANDPAAQSCEVTIEQR